MKTLTLSDNAFSELAAQVAYQLFTGGGVKITDPASIPAPEQAPAPAVPSVPVGSVKLPITGHVLPLPKPFDPEKPDSFWGYMIDNFKAAGGWPGQQSPMSASRAGTMYGEWKGLSPEYLSEHREVWPEMLDYFYNHDAYDPVGAEARAAAKKASDDEWYRVWAEKMANQRAAEQKPAPPPSDAGSTDVAVES